MRLRGLKEGDPVMVYGKPGYKFIEVYVPGMARVKCQNGRYNVIAAHYISRPAPAKKEAAPEPVKPTLVEGSPEWAEEMGKQGHRVAGNAFPCFSDRGKWIERLGDGDWKWDNGTSCSGGPATGNWSSTTWRIVPRPEEKQSHVTDAVKYSTKPAPGHPLDAGNTTSIAERIQEAAAYQAKMRPTCEKCGQVLPVKSLDDAVADTILSWMKTDETVGDFAKRIIAMVREEDKQRRETT